MNCSFSAKSRAFTVVLLLLAMFTARAAESTELNELRELMKTIATEFREGKVETMIAHTHPAFIAMIGGEEKAKTLLPKLLRSDLDAVEQLGFTMTLFEVGEPERVQTAGEWTFALLPTKLVAEGAEGKFTTKSHTLAARKTGQASWYLLRLGLPEAQMQRMLPELPADFVWPGKEKPQFEKRQ